jgi:hydroxyacylglutathione hydrolase
MNQPPENLRTDEQQPHVTVLQTCFRFIKNYVYLVQDPLSRDAVLVDPAWQMDVIEQAIRDAQARLCGILITHSHPDHVHLSKPIADKYQCPIWMSREEIAVSGFRTRQLVGIGAEPWRVGEMLIEPILTPGHTPGCMCYRIGDNLFTGDVLFVEGCGMCSDVASAHAMFASLQHLKRRLKPCTRIFSGHRYGKAPGQLLSDVFRDNIYLQFTDKHAFAAFRLRRGQRMARLFRFE